MNDVDKMPPVCRDCPYWEIAKPPYSCADCKDALIKMSEAKKKKKMGNCDTCIHAKICDLWRKAECQDASCYTNDCYTPLAVVVKDMSERTDCPIRHQNGNCLSVGGFCTAVSDEVCKALQSAYEAGRMSILCGAYCKSANKDASGCLGYSHLEDDEPIERCRKCPEYSGRDMEVEEDG